MQSEKIVLRCRFMIQRSLKEFAFVWLCFTTGTTLPLVFLCTLGVCFVYIILVNWCTCKHHVSLLSNFFFDLHIVGNVQVMTMLSQAVLIAASICISVVGGTWMPLFLIYSNTSAQLQTLTVYCSISSEQNVIYCELQTTRGCCSAVWYLPPRNETGERPTRVIMCHFIRKVKTHFNILWRLI